jgi:hypothetical protein
MLPMMLLLGAAEGTERRPTLLFWLFWLLPFLVLPWLWGHQHPDERVEQNATSDYPGVATDRAAGELSLSVAPVVDVRRSYIRGGLPVAEGRLKTSAAVAFDQLEDLLSPRRQTPLLETAGGGVARVVALPSTLTDAMRRRSRVSVNVLLFLATVVTTVWAGALHQGVNLFPTPEQFLVGLPYAVALLAILGVHEMGHFVVARRHGVDVIALITGCSHLPALDDITPPDAKRFALGAVAMMLLVAIVLPLPEGFMGLMLDCPYL